MIESTSGGPTSNSEILERITAVRGIHRRRLKHIDIELMSRKESLTEKEIKESFSDYTGKGGCACADKINRNTDSFSFLSKTFCYKMHIRKFPISSGSRLFFIRALATFLYLKEDGLRDPEALSTGKLQSMVCLPYGNEIEDQNTILLIRNNAINIILSERKKV
jgi:hypothetical protein